MPEAARREDREPDILDHPPTGWLPAAQAAAALGVTPRTVRNRLAAGRLAGRLARTGDGPAWYVDPAADPRLAVAAGGVPSGPTAEADALGLAGPGAEVARMTARQRDRAARRLAAVTDWRAVRDRLPDGADVQAAFREWSQLSSADHGFRKPISWSTMWRWGKALDAGDVVSLAPRRGGPSPTEPDPAAWAFFRALWLTQGKRTVYDCWVQTGAEARRRRWAWPSYAVINRRVKREIPAPAAILAREGREALENRCVPYIERDYDSIAPNDWWSADHHQLDVACLGPTGRPEFPWITHWQDVKSRKAMVVKLSFQPNLDVVLASLRRAMLVHGVPANLLFDRGKEFRANQFSGGARRVSVEADEARVRFALAHLPTEVHFAVAYNAKAKPNERAFLTTRLQFSKQWATYRGSSPADRPEGFDKVLREYREDGVIPTAAELEAAVIEWFDRVYGARPHRGRGMDGRSPNAVYEAERREVTRVGDEELALLMMRTTRPLTVGRNGVQLFGRKYHAPELFERVGQKVYARYDTAEIGRLYVHDLEDRLICVAERRDLLAWGATHEDVRTRQRAKKRYRQAARAAAQTADLLAGDPLRNIALQRRAAEAAGGRRDEPTPPDGGEPITVRAWRTALADTAEQLRRLPVAAGGEGDAGRPSAEVDLPEAAPPEDAGAADETFDSLDLT